MSFRKVQQGIVNSKNSGTILWRNIEIFPVFIIKHLITGCLDGEMYNSYSDYLTITQASMSRGRSSTLLELTFLTYGK